MSILAEEIGKQERESHEAIVLRGAAAALRKYAEEPLLLEEIEKRSGDRPVFRGGSIAGYTRGISTTKVILHTSSGARITIED